MRLFFNVQQSKQIPEEFFDWCIFYNTLEPLLSARLWSELVPHFIREPWNSGP